MLLFAITNEEPKVIYDLLDREINVFIYDKTDQSALFYAVYQNNVKLVKKIVGIILEKQKLDATHLPLWRYLSSKFALVYNGKKMFCLVLP